MSAWLLSVQLITLIPLSCARCTSSSNNPFDQRGPKNLELFAIALSIVSSASVGNGSEYAYAGFEDLYVGCLLNSSITASEGRPEKIVTVRPFALALS